MMKETVQFTQTVCHIPTTYKHYYKRFLQTHKQNLQLKVACAIIVKKETFKECGRNANNYGGGWVHWAQYKHTKQKLRGDGETS